MTIVVKFQSTGTIPGDGRPVTMMGASMTIGRANDNDLVLPDPDRVVSSHHCAIEDQNGNVVVIDLSTNGTFLNYGKIPLGRVPTPLNDGDILCIGSYELEVGISQGQPTDALAGLPGPVGAGPVAPSGSHADTDLMGLLDGPGSGTDFLDDLLGEAASPVGPSGVQRPQLGEDGLLPPLEDDPDDMFGQVANPDDSMGASQSLHSPSMQDHMQLPRAVSEAIPDDWDLSLPASSAAPPVAQVPPPADPIPLDPLSDDPFEEPFEGPPATGGAAFIPEDDDFGLAPQADDAPLAGDVPVPVAEVAQVATPAPVDPPPQAPPPQVPLVEAAAPTPAVSASAGGDGAAVQALLQAAGLTKGEIAPDEIQPTMTRLGNVLRIMIHGMREILMTRTSIKSEFRIDQTRIAASGNNPLKFSVTPEQAVQVMFQPPARGYLAAEDAAEQALQDIKAHEVAMMTGMEAALKGVLAKLAPDELEGQISSAGGLGDLLKGRKARYWETYERIYADIADQAQNDFHDLFSREFARAYQEQLEKLKDTG